VLRRVFVPTRDQVARGCRISHNEDLHNLYSSANIIKVIKPRINSFVEHVVHTEEMGCIQNFICRTSRKGTIYTWE